MSLEAGLFALIRAQSSIMALQPGGLWPVIVPSNPVFPLTTYHVVGGRQWNGLASVGPFRWRVQFDFHADGERGSYTQAVALRDAYEAFLNGYSGTLAGGVVVQDCRLIQPIDYFDNEARRFRCSAEYYITFSFQGS